MLYSWHLFKQKDDLSLAPAYFAKLCGQLVIEHARRCKCFGCIA